MATMTQSSELSQAPAQRRGLKGLRYNMSRALIVTRREVLDMIRDWRILTPIIMLTIIFPFIANWGAARMIAWVEDFGAAVVGERLIPFLMMVVGFFPISFSLIIALESFAGEKERQSLEPLLSSPMSNLQLYIGKILSSTIPPVVGSLMGISVYLVGVYFSVDYRPPLVLLVQIVLLNVMQALVMVAGAVVVSSQVTSVRAANLLASFIIIPMAFLIQMEALIMFWARYEVLWMILFGLAVLSVVLVRMGVRSFNREELIGGEIDDLNLYENVKLWVTRSLARSTDGGRRGPWRWYQQEVLRPIWEARLAVLIVLAAAAAAYYIGVYYARIFPIPADIFVTDNWYERFAQVLAAFGVEGLAGVWRVFYQNVRALLLATALAVFSLGVIVVLVMMMPFAILGYLIVQMVGAGLDTTTLLAAVLPHAIFEVPAAVLACAMAVRLGASVIAPPPGKTIGEGWLLALADLTRVWAVVVLPLLAAAAFIEVFVSPRLVLLLAGS